MGREFELQNFLTTGSYQHTKKRKFRKIERRIEKFAESSITSYSGTETLHWKKHWFGAFYRLFPWSPIETHSQESILHSSHWISIGIGSLGIWKCIDRFTARADVSGVGFGVDSVCRFRHGRTESGSARHGQVSECRLPPTAAQVCVSATADRCRFRHGGQVWVPPQRTGVGFRRGQTGVGCRFWVRHGGQMSVPPRRTGVGISGISATAGEQCGSGPDCRLAVGSAAADKVCSRRARTGDGRCVEIFFSTRGCCLIKLALAVIWFFGHKQRSSRLYSDSSPNTFHAQWLAIPLHDPAKTIVCNQELQFPSSRPLDHFPKIMRDAT